MFKVTKVIKDLIFSLSLETPAGIKHEVYSFTIYDTITKYKVYNKTHKLGNLSQQFE